MNKQNLTIPCHIESEQSLLGAILLDYKFALNEVLDILMPDYFYKEAHQEIYIAILYLYNKNEPIDMISISNRLKNINKLSFIGGANYLTELTTVFFNIDNVNYYAKTIKGKARLRNLIDIGNKIQTMSYDEGNEYENIIDDAEKMLFEFNQDHEKGAPIHVRNLVRSSLDYIENLQKNKGALLGISSGYSELDKITNGFQKGDLIVLAARPSMGKTSLAVNIACNMGVPKMADTSDNSNNGNILIFSLEMTSEQLMHRIITSEARIDSSKLKRGDTSSAEWRQFLSAMDRISNAKIFISEASSMTYYDIKAVARRTQSKQPLSCIVIDYLQLISNPKKGFDSSNRQNEVAEISRNLKMMAVEINVPIIVLSQLSRDVEKRQNKSPILSDLRDSGAIEQDADIVMFIHRENYYQKTDEDASSHQSQNQKETQNNTKLIIAKHRNGATGDIDMYFHNEYTRFEEVDHHHG